MTEKHLQLMRRALLFVGTLAVFTFTALHAQAGKHLVTWVDGSASESLKEPLAQSLGQAIQQLAPDGGAVQTEDTLNFGDRIQLEQTLPACLQVHAR